MSAPAQPKAASPPTVPLTGAEKVAVLLLALGKPRSAKLLKRFDPDELQVLTQLAGDLHPISASDLESLVEEFAQKFSSGINFVGTEKEVKSLLSEVMGDDQFGAVTEEPEQAPEVVESTWEKAAEIKNEVLRAYLEKEHPQTTAMILSRLDSELSAKILGGFPAARRNELLIRMVGLKKVASDAALAVEQAFAEDLLAKTQNAAHAGIADILNRLEKAQSEEMLKSLAEVRPDDAKALKGMMFSFIELARVPERGRTMLLDQVPIERLVMALRGTDAAFQATILSSLAARSRRMVEAELSGGAPATDRDIAAARREIVDLVLKMIAKGEIVMPATDEVVDEITV